LFAVYSGLYASRNIPVSSLLLVLVIRPWLSDAMMRMPEFAQNLPRWQGLASMQFFRRIETIELNLRGHLWPIAAIAFTCWVATNGGNFGATTLMDAHFDSKRFPVAAVSYMEKQGVQGPLLSPDAWGGYLIYRLSPQVKVVIDDRHDFYGEEFLKSYLKMIHLQPGWEEFLEQQQPHYVIVPKDSALANILLETSAWKAIYTDEVALVFVRSPALLSR
jgi:hypothetical protein